MTKKNMHYCGTRPRSGVLNFGSPLWLSGELLTNTRGRLAPDKLKGDVSEGSPGRRVTSRASAGTLKGPLPGSVTSLALPRSPQPMSLKDDGAPPSLPRRVPGAFRVPPPPEPLLSGTGRREGTEGCAPPGAAGLVGPPSPRRGPSAQTPPPTGVGGGAWAGGRRRPRETGSGVTVHGTAPSLPSPAPEPGNVLASSAAGAPPPAPAPPPQPPEAVPAPQPRLVFPSL